MKNYNMIKSKLKNIEQKSKRPIPIVALYDFDEIHHPSKIQSRALPLQASILKRFSIPYTGTTCDDSCAF